MDDLGFVEDAPVAQDDDIGFVESSPQAPAVTEKSIASKQAGQFQTSEQPFWRKAIGASGLAGMAFNALTGSSNPRIEAVAGGALDTVLAGTPEAIAARSGVNVNDPNSAKFTDPMAYAAGQVAGAALPLGELAGSGTILKEGMKNIVKQGARIGSIMGAGAGVSEVAKKEDATTEDALKSGALYGAGGAALGAAIPLGIAGIQKSISGVINAHSKLFPDAIESLTRGVKPANKLADQWSERAPIAHKYLADTAEPIKTAQNLVDEIGSAKARVYKMRTEALGAQADTMVDGEKLFGKILEAADNLKAIGEDPQSIISVALLAQKYRRPIPLMEAEQLLKETNAELFGPLYSRTQAGQKMARSNVEMKAQENLAKGLREEINGALVNELGPQGADLGNLYGSLAMVGDEASKRLLVAARQAQASFPEQLSYASSVGDVIMGLGKIVSGDMTGGVNVLKGGGKAIAAKHLKELTTTDSLIERSFSKPQMKSREQFLSTIPRGGDVAAKIGDKTFKVAYLGKLSDGKAKIKTKDGKIHVVSVFDLSQSP